MTWLLVGLCAWLAGGGLMAAETPEDEYVRIYYLIQEADNLNAKGELQKAVAKYLEAQSALRKLKSLYPTWQEKVVNFRLNYIAAKLDPLLQRAPAPQPTAPTPPAPSPAPTNPPSAAPTVAAPTPAPVAGPQPPSAAPPAPAAPGPVSSAPAAPAPSESLLELTNQLRALQAEIERLSAQNTLLEAKLKEAWAVQPAAVDPRELAAARAQIAELEKERDLLRVALEEQKARWTNTVGRVVLAQEQQIVAEIKRRLAEQEQLAAALRTENAELKKQNETLRQEADRLRQQSGVLTQQVAELTQKLQAASAPTPAAQPVSPVVAELQASNAALRAELILLEGRLAEVLRETRSARSARDQRQEEQLAAARARIKDLERERAKLQKQLDRYAKELAKRGGATLSPPDETERQLEIARARLQVLEARAAPYAPEELALFRVTRTNAPASPVPTTTRKTLPKVSPSVAALLSEAERATEAGLLAEAEKRYQQVLSQDPTNLFVLTRLVGVQLDQDRLAEAEQTLSKALAVDPEDPACLYLRGTLRLRQGRYDEALDAASLSARLDPDRPETQCLLGRILVEKGQRQAAEAAFRKAIQLRPTWGEPHYQLAVLYAAQQPPFVELAQWHYQKALAGGMPRNPDLEKRLQDQRAAAPEDAR